MKFRKRKDTIQRKNFKQQEIDSILHSYLLKAKRQADYVPTIYTEATSLQKATRQEGNISETIVKKETSLTSKDLWSIKGCSATIRHPFLVNSTVTNLKDKNYDYRQLVIKAKGRLEDQILKIKTQRQDYILNNSGQTNIDTCHSPKSLDLSPELSNVDICLWNQSYYYGIIPTSIGTDSSCVKIGRSVYRGYKPTSKYPTHRSTITKLRNRCIQTNRSRSVSKLFKISRQQVRRLGVKGSLTGCTKSTW